MGAFAGIAGALQGLTTAGRNYNALNQQGLQNQLDQQKMLIEQQRLQLQRQQQALQGNELQWNQGLEMFNVYQQGQAARAAAGMFAQRGQMTNDPKESKFWDQMGNYVMRGGSVTDVMKMANDMGYSNQMKAALMQSQIAYNNARSAGDWAQANMIAQMFPGIDTSGGGGMGGSSMLGHGPMPSAGYGGGAGTPPTAGGALGGLGSPIGTTNKYRNTMQRKGDKWYYIDASGNVYGPIPTAGAEVAGADTGAESGPSAGPSPEASAAIKLAGGTP